MPFKPPLSVKTWRSTRPSSCKDSGVGKAIEAFLKVDDDPEKIPLAESFNQALDNLKTAATALKEALEDAEGKINLKKDPKQGKATQDLIDGWTENLDDYFDKLEKRKKKAVTAAELVVTTREQALKIANDYIKKYRTWAKSLEDAVTNAAKHVKNAESSREEGDMMQNQMAIDLVKRYFEECSAVVKEANDEYAENFKKGPVLDSRQDGATLPDVRVFDEQLAKKLQEKSNKLFRECTVITNEINELLDSISTNFGELRTLLAEAETHSMVGIDPEKYVTMLDEVTEEAAKMVQSMATTLDKISGMARNLNALLKVDAEKSAKLSKVELLEQKQYLPRVAILKETAKTPPILERRIKAVPKRVLDEYRTVSEAHERATSEINKLKSTMKRAIEQSAQLGKTFPLVKKSLS